MAEAIKHMFGREVVRSIGARVNGVHPAFDEKAFEASVVADLEGLELLARSKRIARGLREGLPGSYPRAVKVLVKAMGNPGEHESGMGRFADLPFLNVVGLFGVEHPAESLDALEEMTKHFSGEWDIRPFLIHHEALTLARLRVWAGHADWRVRRLATEGSRPRLPWGVRLERYVKDPTPTVAILELLRDDAHANVRNSVANHLNDIAKDNPDVALDVAERWSVGASPERKRIVRHALRGLVKHGHPRALAVLGHTTDAVVRAEAFKLSPKRVAVGGAITFSATLVLEGKAPASVVIDYRIHHQRAGGKTSPKVFKLSKRRLTAGGPVELRRTHAIVPLTTRRYYPGEHRVELLVNGRVVAEGRFELT